MPKVLLTDRFCAHAKPQAGENRTPYCDTATKDLELQVSDKTKAWYYRFTSPKDAVRAVLKLGTYPTRRSARPAPRPSKPRAWWRTAWTRAISWAAAQR